MLYDLVPGAAASPVILHVPHASRAITAAARRSLTIGDDALGEELDHLTDAHTDRIARAAAERAAVRPWILENRWSRLVVDPERLPGDREEMRRAGMGPVYTHGYAGRRLRRDDPEGEARLLAEHFHPYAAAMADLVDDRLATTGRAVVIDVHSYPSAPLPYELHGDGERPEICLGTDAVHTPPGLVAAAAAAFAGFSQARDTPFAGCYVPLRHHGRDRAVTGLMVEIRRDTYMAEPGGPPRPGLDRLVSGLAALVDRVPAGRAGGPPAPNGRAADAVR